MQEFDWDDNKALSNLERHRLSFDEAIAVFADPKLLTVDTSREEDGEPREKAIGRIQDRLSTVVFTRRGSVVRLISARRANAQEIRLWDAHFST